MWLKADKKLSTPKSRRFCKRMEYKNTSLCDLIFEEKNTKIYIKLEQNKAEVSEQHGDIETSEISSFYFPTEVKQTFEGKR